MSGWNSKDRFMAEDVGDDFPAMNNITVRGQLPSDMVPAPSKSQISFSSRYFSKIKDPSRGSFQIPSTL